MELNERLDKFEKLVSNTPSNFLSKLAYYKANKKWIDQSSKIAISVLEALREKGLSQKDLAKKMNVSAQQVNKIIKGQQNLTFETVGKIEDALEIPLMEIIEFKSANEIKTKEAIVQAMQETISDKIAIEKTETKLFSENFQKSKSAKMSVVYNKNKNLINYNKPTYNKAI